MNDEIIEVIIKTDSNKKKLFTNNLKVKLLIALFIVALIMMFFVASIIAFVIISVVAIWVTGSYLYFIIREKINKRRKFPYQFKDGVKIFDHRD